MSNLLVKREVTFQNLQSLAGQPNNKRVGATVNPKNRKKQYRSKGYTGTFYYASVQNMKVAEQKLLRCTDTHTCPCNVDSDSKAPERPGYVYCIQWWNASNTIYTDSKGQEICILTTVDYHWVLLWFLLRILMFYLRLEGYTLYHGFKDKNSYREAVHIVVPTVTLTIFPAVWSLYMYSLILLYPGLPWGELLHLDQGRIQES